MLVSGSVAGNSRSCCRLPVHSLLDGQSKIGNRDGIPSSRQESVNL